MPDAIITAGDFFSQARFQFDRFAGSEGVAHIRALAGQTPRVTENNWLEFKTGRVRDEDIKPLWSKVLSSFANSGGGAVIWGIRAGRATLALYRINEFVATMREEFGQLVNEEFCTKAINPLFGAIARMAIAGVYLKNGKKGGFPQDPDNYITDPWDSYNLLTPMEIEAFELVNTYKDAYESKRRLKRTWFVDEDGK